MEVEFRLGDQAYALEHTQIESFPGQIQANLDFISFIAGLEPELTGTLPKPGTYTLLLPMFVKVPAVQVKLVQTAIIAWVKKKAIELHARGPVRPRSRRDDWITETPPDVPYPLWISRTVYDHPANAHLNGSVMITRIAQSDLDNQRPVRMAMTMEKKNPKLVRCKAAGARTILVLEDNDISLSNDAILSEQLEKQTATYTNMPDEVWLVWPVGATWYVQLLYSSGVYPEERDITPVESAILRDLTNSQDRG
ncbi:hypothetical protein [Ferrovibrio xuzhouensis]|uniref:Uncharacterized protein n=1 Tax=Ferrovibrio xuzhouensis TaxID=1576914 RepID=A0ABV7VIH9_9PROT